MRPITRFGVAAAIVAAMAVAGPAPAGATPSTPPVGSTTAAAARSATVTLITGDRVEVDAGADGRHTVEILPREDGTQPIVQTRQFNGDMYVYPDDAAAALAAGLVDEQLFNVTGLIAQGYDDAHSSSLPVIATYRTDLSLTRSAPPVPAGATRTQSLPSVDGVALNTAKKDAASFWKSLTSPSMERSSSFPLKKLWLDEKVGATGDDLDRDAEGVPGPGGELLASVAVNRPQRKTS